MTRYVCGFFFNDRLDSVVLIWKNKPAWQKGKLNGVGGKIEENETIFEAMRREFREESGIDHKEWTSLTMLCGEDWEVYFFCAKDTDNQFEYAETKEEEEIAKIEVDTLDHYDHIENLRWLVPMAEYRLRYPEQFK